MPERKTKQKTTVLVETVEDESEEDSYKEEKEYTVSFKMNGIDHEQLEKYAEKNGMSKSLIIRKAVKKYVSSREGFIEVQLPKIDYKNLKHLIESGQVLSMEAAVAEAVRLLNIKKANELKEMKNAMLYQ
jgi:hypothetical protein